VLHHPRVATLRLDHALELLGREAGAERVLEPVTGLLGGLFHARGEQHLDTQGVRHLHEGLRTLPPQREDGLFGLGRLAAGGAGGRWPLIAHPIFMTWARSSASDRPVRNPGMASSLSSVPPVWPRPRPDIIGTATPHAATRGASTSDTLSPTPPVECLSTRGVDHESKEIRWPEASIASVRAASSGRSSPRSSTAISSADIW